MSGGTRANPAGQGAPASPGLAQPTRPSTAMGGPDHEATASLVNGWRLGLAAREPCMGGRLGACPSERPPGALGAPPRGALRGRPPQVRGRRSPLSARRAPEGERRRDNSWSRNRVAREAPDKRGGFGASLGERRPPVRGTGSRPSFFRGGSPAEPPPPLGRAMPHDTPSIAGRLGWRSVQAALAGSIP